MLYELSIAAEQSTSKFSGLKEEQFIISCESVGWLSSFTASLAWTSHVITFTGQVSKVRSGLPQAANGCDG